MVLINSNVNHIVYYPDFNTSQTNVPDLLLTILESIAYTLINIVVKT